MKVTSATPLVTIWSLSRAVTKQNIRDEIYKYDSICYFKDLSSGCNYTQATERPGRDFEEWEKKVFFFNVSNLIGIVGEVCSTLRL